MCCLYCAASSADESSRLQKRLAAVIGASSVERLRDPEELAARLRKESWSVRLVVLLVSSEQNLDHLMRHAALLRGIKILIGLPVHLAGLSGRASKLRPRFVDTGSTDWCELAEVAGRIMNRPLASRADASAYATLPASLQR